MFLRFGFKLQTRLQRYQDIETAATALSELVYLSLLGFREAQRQIEHGRKMGLTSLCVEINDRWWKSVEYLYINHTIPRTRRDDFFFIVYKSK